VSWLFFLHGCVDGFFLALFTVILASNTERGLFLESKNQERRQHEKNSPQTKRRLERQLFLSQKTVSFIFFCFFLHDADLCGDLHGVMGGSEADVRLLGTIRADQSVDLDGLDLVQGVHRALDLGLVGARIHQEGQGVVVLDLLHGSVSDERVLDDAELVPRALDDLGVLVRLVCLGLAVRVRAAELRAGVRLALRHARNLLGRSVSGASGRSRRLLGRLGRLLLSRLGRRDGGFLCCFRGHLVFGVCFVFALRGRRLIQ